MNCQLIASERELLRTAYVICTEHQPIDRSASRRQEPPCP